MDGILNSEISDLPVSVVDVETTGLTPRNDRIIEISVVRIEPNKEPELILDTLINPLRPVAATEIHGITDDDVQDAPKFNEIAELLSKAISGSVVLAYNAYFDMRFLCSEFDGIGQSIDPPYACLMYLRPVLGFGARCTLKKACDHHQINWQPSHSAGSDAMAAACLWPKYLDRMTELGLVTYEDLAKQKSYKFVKSFVCKPLPIPEIRKDSTVKLKTRSEIKLSSEITPDTKSDTIAPSVQTARHEYWDTLKAVLSDLTVTRGEQALLDSKRSELGLAVEQVRSLHARIFAAAIISAIEDRWLDDREASALNRLHLCLHKLGWAPGDLPAPKRSSIKSLSSKTVVLTGTLETFGRSEITEKLEMLGAKVTKSVSNNTDLLIYGTSPGSKFDRAKSLGIETWDENRLIKALK